MKIVGILSFMSGKNTILGLSEPKKAIFFYFLKFKISCSIELSMKKALYPRDLNCFTCKKYSTYIRKALVKVCLLL